jgi:hypothetical protein
MAFPFPPSVASAVRDKIGIRLFQSERLWIFFVASSLSDSISLALRHFHHIGAPEQPIHAHLKAVRDLRQPVNVQHLDTRGGKVNATPAAKADADAEPVKCDAASPAYMREPFAEQVEIGVHE